MPWTKLSNGTYAGRTLPEVILAAEDPDFLFTGIRCGVFLGPLLSEAWELSHKASRICLPWEDPSDVTFYYRHAGEESFGGIAVVPARDAARYRPFAAAESHGLDLSMPCRVAPKDPNGTSLLVTGLKLDVWGELHPDLTPEACAAFFGNVENFL